MKNPLHVTTRSLHAPLYILRTASGRLDRDYAYGVTRMPSISGFSSDLATTKPSAHDPGAIHRGQRGYLEAQISKFRNGLNSSEYNSTTVYPIEPIFEPPI